MILILLPWTITYIEEKYNSDDAIPGSVKTFYENAVIDVYNISGDIHWVVDGLKWLPTSEKMRKIVGYLTNEEIEESIF